MECSHPQPKIWKPSDDVCWCELCGSIRLDTANSPWVFPHSWSPRGVATMDTVSGRRISILEPSSLDVAMSDIAHHLAMQVRFNGEIRFFYSVGEHSNNVGIATYYRLLGPDVPDPRKFGFPDLPEDMNPRRVWGAILRGFVHDGSEAILGDCIRPLKAVLPVYKRIEKLHMDAIHEHLGFWPDEDWAWADELVDAVDKHVYHVENHVLRGAPKAEERGVEFEHRENWEAVRDQFLRLTFELTTRFRMAA